LVVVGFAVGVKRYDVGAAGIDTSLCAAVNIFFSE
jgi:hypothetical protein